LQCDSINSKPSQDDEAKLLQEVFGDSDLGSDPSGDSKAKKPDSSVDHESTSEYGSTTGIDKNEDHGQVISMLWQESAPILTNNISSGRRPRSF
jgi:hypothetical protein